MAIVRSLSKREKMIACIVVVFIGIAVSYSIVIEPVFSRWKRLDKEISKKMIRLKEDMAILSCETSESSCAKSKNNNDENVADMLALIEAISRQDSCLIVNIKSAGAKQSGLCEEIMVDTNIEASLAQIAKFLYDIENQKDMVLKVQRFTINSSSGSQGILKGSFFIGSVVINSLHKSVDKTRRKSL